MEVLSEHCCQGWLEGYLLTGRHGMWSSYEAFAQVVDSMLTQHAKWLEQCRDFPWRRPLASLNVLLTSHAWRQDHNGFSHQATGFVDNALARRSETIRVYYPPDSNCLLSVFDHCLRSRNYVNIVTCGKQPQLQWLTMDEAREHCSRGASIWKFATNDGGEEPDVVLACAGDVPTIEICATSWLLQKYVPGIKVRVVNVVDLTALMMPDDHPHGMDNMSFDALFTKDAPVIFAFHNNRWLIHSMVHGRSNEARFHVRGYMDRGTTTTPFDMVVLNEMSRFHLAIDALKHVPRLRSRGCGRRRHVQAKALRAPRLYSRASGRYAGDPELALDGRFQRANALPLRRPRGILAQPCSPIANVKARSPLPSTAPRYCSHYLRWSNPPQKPTPLKRRRCGKRQHVVCRSDSENVVSALCATCNNEIAYPSLPPISRAREVHRERLRVTAIASPACVALYQFVAPPPTHSYTECEITAVTSHRTTTSDRAKSSATRCVSRIPFPLCAPRFAETKP